MSISEVIDISPCTPSSKKRGFIGSHPGCGLGSTLSHALSSRLFSGPLAELLLSENTFLFLLTQYFWGKKNGLLFPLQKHD